MKLKKIISGGLVLVLSISVISFAPEYMAVYADTKPDISAQGAAVYNADTGEFLYEKNGDKQFYPASITKIMTGLLTVEQANLDDTITFSRSATTNLESGSTSLGVMAGDTMSVRDALYGMMLASANEVSNGLAEHVGGSVAGFANMMNNRAKELGATHTNFVNPNGLNNQNHVTTAKDMALIAAAAFRNPTFRAVAGASSYSFPATKSKPTPKLIKMHHKMVTGEISYAGVIGGKTGYTKSAGNTLVTAAERNGVRLIVVVLKCNGTHYTDTRKLLDYGFSIASKDTGRAVAKKQEVAPAKKQEVAPVKKQEVAVTKKQETAPKTETAQNVEMVDSAMVETGPKEIRTSSMKAQNYGPGMEPDIGWKENNGDWVYVKSDNSSARAEVLTINGKKYWFDSDGNMAKGWRQDTSGSWYFMEEDTGTMNASAWLKYNGLWYYFGSDGKMLTNTITPDGYVLNSDGVWVS